MSLIQQPFAQIVKLSEQREAAIAVFATGVLRDSIIIVLGSTTVLA